MDNKLKEKIDSIFKKHPGNAICLEMFQNIDYGDRARDAYWSEWIEEISNELELNNTYNIKGLPETISFANLGVSYDDLPNEDIEEIDQLAVDIGSIVNWDVHDFDGEVNQYWSGFVIVTNDYKVLRITSTGSGDALYRSTIADLSKLGSQEDEMEKNALAEIKESIKEIKENLKVVKSEKGKETVKKLIEKLKI